MSRPADHSQPEDRPPLGTRLLEAVATMDRLRSPGGCPWDAEQTHASLAPYLLEEAYEAYQALEDGDSDALREEIGDVLLQVLFHARIAQERTDGTGWDIDDVADELVDKLVRRHPHVFGDVDATDADTVIRNWEEIKAAERGDASVVASVPMAAPALTLAATLQRKTARLGHVHGGDLDALLADFEREPSEQTAGQLLWSLVDAMRLAGLDAETVLRARARVFRDSVEAPGDTLDRPASPDSASADSVNS